ncbi:ATPase family gene 2 protein homolog B-like [Ornithodoros turicata]|uniref:ATPase family gene 2 protein homolog B-like n=1 Tax=Ornithodoros turicata TaxID=34597 RepID=UPI00313A288B
MELKCVSVDELNIGSQNCFLPETFLLELSCYPGSLVEVCAEQATFLCIAFPHRYTSAIAYIDKTVSIPNNATNIKSYIKPLEKSSPAGSACVTIVLESVHDLVRWQKSPERLKHWISRIIRNYHVCNECLIDCRTANRQLARLCRVDTVVVHKISSDSTSSSSNVFKITGACKFTLKDVTYKSAFDDKTQFKNCSLSRQVCADALCLPTRILKDLCTFPYLYPETLRAIGLRLHRGVLLTGHPGTGKTTVVSNVARESGAHLMTIRGPEMCRSLPGESEAQLRKVFQEASAISEVVPCILLIDDVDVLCAKRGSGTSRSGSRLVTQLLTLMDGISDRRRVFVVATTSNPNAIDAAMRRPGRFDKEIALGALSLSEREAILRDIEGELGTETTHLITDTSGFVLGDMMAMLRETLMSAAEHSHMVPSKDDIKKSIASVRSQLSQRLEFAVELSSSPSWNTLGGVDVIRKKLQMAVEGPLLHPEHYSRLALTRPRGVLLVGPPGCGKTSLALCTAQSCPGSTLFSISAANIYSPYVGDSEKVIASVFNQARLRQPSIIFLDDLDTLCGKRSGDNSASKDRVLSTLLCEIDGISGGLTQAHHEDKGEHANVMVLATTCHPEAVDDALIRPGRLDLVIYVPLPDFNGRVDILRAVLSRMAIQDINVSCIAGATEGFTAADLANLCQMAGLEALMDRGFDVPYIEQHHFMAALGKISPSLTQCQVDKCKEACAKYCFVT